MSRSTDRCDPCLRPFVEAQTDEERDAALEVVLAGIVQPTIRRVLGRQRHMLPPSPDAEEDIAATVVVRLLRRLYAMLVFEEDAVAQLDDYVATLTYHTVYDSLRTRFPQRTRLRNRLRHTLEHDARFATWTDGDDLICGLPAWEHDPPLADAALLSDRNLPVEALDQSHPAEALAAILHYLGRPVFFDALQRSVAKLWNVNDSTSDDALPFLPDPRRSPLDHVQSRQYLAALWREIALLPAAQRTALILNLRDGDGRNAAAQFILLGVTTFDDLAGAIGISPVRLEALWNDLPLADLDIGAMLGLTRQQVISLRHAARRRLGRRLRELATGRGHNQRNRASDDE